VPLFEFLLRAAYSWQHWAELAPDHRATLAARANTLWA
jgi:hypothetical protein